MPNIWHRAYHIISLPKLKISYCYCCWNQKQKSIPVLGPGGPYTKGNEYHLIRIQFEIISLFSICSKEQVFSRNYVWTQGPRPRDFMPLIQWISHARTCLLHSLRAILSFSVLPCFPNDFSAVDRSVGLPPSTWASVVVSLLCWTRSHLPACRIHCLLGSKGQNPFSLP